MKKNRVLMGMPIAVEIANGDATAQEAAIEKVFEYFKHVDEKFSTYKDTSEITAINKKEIDGAQWSEEMQLVFTLAEETKKASDGYFNIQKPDGSYDPSGLVKGWAIWNAAQILIKEGFPDFYVDAGGDIQPYGTNEEGRPWAIGIKNPWNERENIKIVYAKNNEGVATSGTYIRGEHIYDPHTGGAANAIASLTVIGPNIYEADRFATAAFAMGKEAIRFIESLPGFEGYMIDNDKIATMTTGFEKYTDENYIVDNG
jgi:thiamine biosynthesis lipoprotein